MNFMQIFRFPDKPRPNQKKSAQNNTESFLSERFAKKKKKKKMLAQLFLIIIPKNSIFKITVSVTLSQQNLRAAEH